jgi:spore maturation protein CgeB
MTGRLEKIGSELVKRLKIIIIGLSIRSSWGNGHATTYRSLLRGLVRRGHDVRFLEQDVPWYASNSDLPILPEGSLSLYSDFGDLRQRFQTFVHDADVVVVGSYTPQGVDVGRWVLENARGITAFYDIDTPITLEKLDRRDTEYLSSDMIAQYDLYLSFTGGPTLERLRGYGASVVRPLYCSVDVDSYYPEKRPTKWDLGYMGTYSEDRAASLESLLLTPAGEWKDGKMVVAGSMYPADMTWPNNVNRIEHLSPKEHRGFYSSLRYTLNLTRRAMKLAGYSPSIRLFEAAACGCAIITDYWDGLADFFIPGEEILVAHHAGEVLELLREFPNWCRADIGMRARKRTISEHSGAIRAMQLEQYVSEL